MYSTTLIALATLHDLDQVLHIIENKALHNFPVYRFLYTVHVVKNLCLGPNQVLKLVNLRQVTKG